MTNKYKVGDIIYAKGEVKEIDSEDDYLPYRVNFENNNISSWLSEDSILESPVKPVLPNNIADEMEDLKAMGFDLIDYFSAIDERADDVKNSREYVHGNTDESTEARIGTLADAWYHGYTIDKPKLYNLILDDDYNGKIICLFKLTLVDEIWAAYNISDIDLKHNEEYQFTQEEIDKYNKDFWIKNLDLNDYKVEVPNDKD